MVISEVFCSTFAANALVFFYQALMFVLYIMQLMKVINTILFKGPIVWSTPTSIVWPPIQTNQTLIQMIQWEDSEARNDFLDIVLLIPTRLSSGLPGEV